VSRGRLASARFSCGRLILKPETVVLATKTERRRRRFDAAWKRALVEQALVPGASAAKRARVITM